jgi:transposase
MARTILRRINQYSEEFKATAVALSKLRGVLIQDVASSLDIHPFMLSRRRKEVREGKVVTKRVNLEPQRKAELKRLREVERRYKLLQEEHEIVKKPSGLLPNRNRNLPATRTSEAPVLRHNAGVEHKENETRWIMR